MESTYCSIVHLTNVSVETASTGNVNYRAILLVSFDAKVRCGSSHKTEWCSDMDLHNDIESVVAHRMQHSIEGESSYKRNVRLHVCVITFNGCYHY